MSAADDSEGVSVPSGGRMGSGEVAVRGGRAGSVTCGSEGVADPMGGDGEIVVVEQTGSVACDSEGVPLLGRTGSGEIAVRAGGAGSVDPGGAVERARSGRT